MVCDDRPDDFDSTMFERLQSGYYGRISEFSEDQMQAVLQAADESFRCGMPPAAGTMLELPVRLRQVVLKCLQGHNVQLPLIPKAQ